MNNTIKAIVIAGSVSITVLTAMAILKPEPPPAPSQKLKTMAEHLTPEPPPPTLEQKTEKAASNARYVLKQSLNDPDSFELIEIRGGPNKDGTGMTFLFKFRENNVFGAKVISRAIVRTDMDGNVIE